jgi:hypothetical protein
MFDVLFFCFIEDFIMLFTLDYNVCYTLFRHKTIILILTKSEKMMVGKNTYSYEFRFHNISKDLSCPFNHQIDTH